MDEAGMAFSTVVERLEPENIGSSFPLTRILRGGRSLHLDIFLGVDRHHRDFPEHFQHAVAFCGGILIHVGKVRVEPSLSITGFL